MGMYLFGVILVKHTISYSHIESRQFQQDYDTKYPSKLEKLRFLENKLMNLMK